ncbi:uncharacterized protein F5147DRAFT_658062 [Suillus discolor]|uniref:Uncharacterized protein n=1 Tax=Suillus discolor TaxID=1912936 RepID=A0A9P7EVS3_9AGAM|nr:uncharacterized protein F5147DRAFT_658060 [Suillus discolor]XP_041286374.1 uncharacterized protein F5147DRAFT_658062 [Suillus discolor]KAG2090919.1 hypothetical protein F5147DRAFT_658060 [Suillus discolor]KAG2090921.1 hypothetical protein F5147DRAFT_658062 [Suillus discolor]
MYFRGMYYNCDRGKESKETGILCSLLHENNKSIIMDLYSPQIQLIDACQIGIVHCYSNIRSPIDHGGVKSLLLAETESPTKTQKVCTKVASYLEQGQHLKNLSWQLCHYWLMPTMQCKCKFEHVAIAVLKQNEVPLKNLPWPTQESHTIVARPYKMQLQLSLNSALGLTWWDRAFAREGIG